MEKSAATVDRMLVVVFDSEPKAYEGKKEKKINQLDTNIQARLEKAKERRQTAGQRAKAKAEILKTKAAVLKAKAAQAGDVVPD